MAILVKHNKVSTVPDTSDTSLVRPSDWNADHTLTGFGTAAEKDAGVPNGVATLDSSGKVPTSQIPLQGDLNYQGTWNASTNTPTLTSSVGTQGYYYVVNVAGTTNLNGITDWQIGDWAIYNGSVWQKVDNTDAVSSVNGQTGTVVLTTTNIAEGTNEYFTTARARASVSAGTAISYDNGTGVITNSAPDQVVSLTGAGTTSITGTYPNFTITSNDEFDGDVVGPASATDNAIARYDSTTGKLIQNSVVTVSDTGVIDGATTITNLDYLDFDTTYNTTLGAGQLGWNGNDTLGLGMIGGNVVQHIGEDTFFYVKASATITKGQLCMFTGAVGSSGVLTAAPATAIPFAEAIIGVAAENIANNGFGLIQNTGTLKGVNTSAFLDGDILYYNSAVTGGFTKTFPTSGPIVIAAAVAKSGSGGSGILTVRISFQTRVTAGTAMSVTQGNDVVTVTNTAPDQTVVLTAGTGISTSGTYPSFTVTNTAPDQTVAISSGTGISVSGTYPNFTVTNTSPSSGGTVTSVDVSGGTTGLTTSGGPITGSGTITLTGTLGVANGGTGLTSLTANRVPYGNGTSALGNEADFTYDPSLNTVTAPQVAASNGIFVNSATVSASYSIPSGSNAMSAGVITIANGITVTVPNGNNWIIV
jgi:hypothetical protein